MPNPVASFDKSKETIRRQLLKAATAYQRLAQIDLDDITRENASQLYQEYVAVEIEFEGVGGILDVLRRAFIQAGEAFVEQLERVGFAGEPQPTLADDIDNEGVDAFKEP